MNPDQLFLFALLFGIFVLLLWGRIRYDIVAFGALTVAYIGGAIPQEAVFAGFGHPATLIIALVLIISQGLYGSGAIEVLARHLVNTSKGLRVHVAVMSTVGAALSAVMNNVAALALLMPVDMQAARKAKRSPALTLMPLSFASILGGMVTLIGTPPNVVMPPTDPRYVDGGPGSRVPSVAGMDLDLAQTRIKEAGFQLSASVTPSVKYRQ